MGADKPEIVSDAMTPKKPDIEGFLWAKALDILCGLASAIIGSVLVPMGLIAFRQYDLNYFLSSDFIPSLCIFLLTVLVWAAVALLSHKKWAAVALSMLALSIVAFAVCWMMQTQIGGLRTDVRVQFRLYYFGMVSVCELVMIGFGVAAYKAYKAYSQPT
jgi:hypothetical protein